MWLTLLMAFFSLPMATGPILLGKPSSQDVWVYLTGLTTDFHSQEEEKHRNLLYNIAENLDIQICAIEPIHKCNGKFHWPHDNAVTAERTYREILSQIPEKGPAGYIGFSNGGFFLYKLAEQRSLGVPIITIGAAGYCCPIKDKNTFYLLIGKEDTYHYPLAQAFHKYAKSTPIDLQYIEYDQGHVLPESLLKSVLDQSRQLVHQVERDRENTLF